MTGAAVRRRAVVTAGAGLAVVAVALGLILFDQPEVRALRGVDNTVTIPATTHLARGANTLTTVPPTTTTTVAPATTTTAPASTTTTETAASVDDLAGIVAACSSGYFDTVEVIPGGTSYTRWTGSHITLRLSEWHLHTDPAYRCYVIRHEDGHAHAATHNPTGGSTVAGWPYSVEEWADCYAQVHTGGTYDPCPNLELAKGLM